MAPRPNPGASTPSEPPPVQLRRSAQFPQVAPRPPGGRRTGSPLCHHPPAAALLPAIYTPPVCLIVVHVARVPLTLSTKMVLRHHSSIASYLQTQDIKSMLNSITLARSMER